MAAELRTSGKYNLIIGVSTWGQPLENDFIAGQGKTFDITTADGQPLALGRGNSYVCIMDPKTSKVDVLLVN